MNSRSPLISGHKAVTKIFFPKKRAQHTSVSAVRSPSRQEQSMGHYGSSAGNKKARGACLSVSYVFVSAWLSVLAPFCDLRTE